MRPRAIVILSIAFTSLSLPVAGVLRAEEPNKVKTEPAAADAFASFTQAWRKDEIWHDGKAEVTIYDATRTIYDKQRKYTARLYTNKEHASPNSKTKDTKGQGRAVFKHHLREDIDTENYRYHYSTMCYVGIDDLKSLKIDMGSQEDCGASFKQVINHDGELTWNLFSYFPSEGHKTGSDEAPNNLVFHDALSLVLRGFPFRNPPDTPVFLMLPDQTTTYHSGIALQAITVRYKGRKFVHLPIGRVDSEHLAISIEGSGDKHEYWFDFDHTAPRLNVMVQYKGPGGITYKLRKHGRLAYWQR